MQTTLLLWSQIHRFFFIFYFTLVLTPLNYIRMYNWLKGYLTYISRTGRDWERAPHHHCVGLMHSMVEITHLHEWVSVQNTFFRKSNSILMFFILSEFTTVARVSRRHYRVSVNVLFLENQQILYHFSSFSFFPL